jgi:hypothetical protein
MNGESSAHPLCILCVHRGFLRPQRTTKIFLAIKTKLHYIFSIVYAAFILRILILPDNKDWTDHAGLRAFRVTSSA